MGPAQQQITKEHIIPRDSCNQGRTNIPAPSDSPLMTATYRQIPLPVTVAASHKFSTLICGYRATSSHSQTQTGHVFSDRYSKFFTSPPSRLVAGIVDVIVICQTRHKLQVPTPTICRSLRLTSVGRILPQPLLILLCL